MGFSLSDLLDSWGDDAKRQLDFFVGSGHGTLSDMVQGVFDGRAANMVMNPIDTLQSAAESIGAIGNAYGISGNGIDFGQMADTAIHNPFSTYFLLEGAKGAAMAPAQLARAAKKFVASPEGLYAEAALSDAAKALADDTGAIKISGQPKGPRWRWSATRQPQPGSVYEVSSAGDSRFSAKNMILSDGRSVEEAWQLDVKGYRSTGATDWRAGKGKPPLVKMSVKESYEKYLELVRQWADENPHLIEDLRLRAQGKPLNDKFAYSGNNQARALADILNDEFYQPVVPPRSMPKTEIPAGISPEEWRRMPDEARMRLTMSKYEWNQYQAAKARVSNAANSLLNKALEAQRLRAEGMSAEEATRVVAQRSLAGDVETPTLLDELAASEDLPADIAGRPVLERTPLAGSTVRIPNEPQPMSPALYEPPTAAPGLKEPSVVNINDWSKQYAVGPDGRWGFWRKSDGALKANPITGRATGEGGAIDTTDLTGTRTPARSIFEDADGPMLPEDMVDRRTWVQLQDVEPVYIGRKWAKTLNGHKYDFPGSPLGNPFKIDAKITKAQEALLGGEIKAGTLITREVALKAYRKWIYLEYSKAFSGGKSAVFDAINDLIDQYQGGKQLVFVDHCTPLACHGDIVKEFMMWVMKNPTARRGSIPGA